MLFQFMWKTISFVEVPSLPPVFSVDGAFVNATKELPDVSVKNNTKVIKHFTKANYVI